MHTSINRGGDHSTPTLKTFLAQSMPDVVVVGPDGRAFASSHEPAVEEHRLTLSFGRDNRDIHPQAQTLTLEEVAARFAEPEARRGRLKAEEYHALNKNISAEKSVRDNEKNGEYFVAATFGGDGRRIADNIEELSGLVLDFDSGRTRRAAIEAKLDGLTFFAYTSYSHRPADPRWRVCIPYVNPITPAQHKAVFGHFNALFDGDLDESCKKPGQIYYTPACPHDAVDQFESFFQDGKLFDPTTITEADNAESGSAASDEKQHAGGPESVDVGRLTDALKHIDPDPRSIWVEVGLAIKHDLGEKGLPIWIEWSSRSNKFDPADAVKTWQSLKPNAGVDAITCASVFHRAMQAGWAPPGADVVPPEIAALNEDYFVAPIGRKVFVFRKAADPVDGGVRYEPMVPADFKLLLQNKSITITSAKGKPRDIPLADYWLKHPKRRQYAGVILSPGQDIPGFFNLWQGFAVEAKQGSWEQMRGHLLRTICNGNKWQYRYLLRWMAWAVQHPGQPAEVALVLRGGRGVGKGVFARSFGRLFGLHFLQINHPKHLTGSFNGHLESCVLLFVDEGFWAGDKAGEGVLKGLITEPTIAIERKGIDVVRARSCLHMIFASNNDWVVPAGHDERRYFGLDVADVNKQDPAYFKPIYDEMSGDGLAAMLYDLQRYDLSRFDIRQVPQTKTLGEQKLQSLSAIEKWWLDKLVAGEFVDRPGSYHGPTAWGQVPTTAVANDYVNALTRVGMSRKASETELGMHLKKLLPPGQHRQRVTTTIGVQTYVYNFPPLVDCRAHFESMMKLDGKIDWTTGEVTD